MKDEIKEILSLLKSSSWCNEANQIEDYITNLQEKYDKALTDLVHESHKRIELYKENQAKDQEIERLNNIIDELEKELDNLIIFNQSNITCNHYTPDDWKDSKLIDNMLYKMKPISFLAQELKDKLKELKEGK